MLLYGLIGPFAAGMMNRFGVRRVMVLAFTLISCGVLATRFLRAPWQLDLLWGLVVGAGTGTTAIVMGTTVVNRWFHSHRGLLIGVLSASTATGQLLFLPGLAALVEHRGWRAATSVVAIAAVLIVPLAALFMRDDARQVGLRPYALPEGEPAPPSPSATRLPRRSWRSAMGLRSRDFYLLAGSFFVCGASTNGLVGTHLVPACMDHGIPEVRAAGLLAVMGIFDLVGTTASGWLSDRFSNRLLLFTYYGLRGLSLLYLPHAFRHGTRGLSAFAIFYGLDWIATVPPTVALTTRSFGRERANVMFGWIIAAHQVARRWPLTAPATFARPKAAMTVRSSSRQPSVSSPPRECWPLAQAGGLSSRTSPIRRPMRWPSKPWDNQRGRHIAFRRNSWQMSKEIRPKNNLPEDLRRRLDDAHRGILRVHKRSRPPASARRSASAARSMGLWHFSRLSSRTLHSPGYGAL